MSPSRNGGARFGTLFPRLPLGNPGNEAIDALARRLINPPQESTENLWIRAGYTYLGQFVDHDITFDPTSQLDRDNDPNALHNFRTPRFDLDSLYGTGPRDQPFLYDWDAPVPGVKLLVGSNQANGRVVADLPRNQQGRALIGDPRNDENIIVSQLHLLFINFHNRVIDRLLEEEPSLEDHNRELLARAQETVRWHYQWIVMKDFLPKIVGADVAAAAINGQGDDDDLRTPSGTPFMPVEFSGAAYRFGHSMVRENYVLNDAESAVSIFGPPSRDGTNLVGRRPLRPNLQIEWKHFFDTTSTPPVNKSMRIDPYLVAPLRHVPPDGQPLALLNLKRGVALELPDAREVATKLGIKPLDDDQLIAPLHVGRDWAFRDALLRATPLWYYVLCEAMLLRDGRQLGPLGGRIVAKVLGALLRDDPASWLVKDPRWTPNLPRADESTFTMVDFVNFAES